MAAVDSNTQNKRPKRYIRLMHLPKFKHPFLEFIYQEAASCLFPGLIFALLLITKLVPMPIPRYDVLLVCCIGIQIWMVWGIKVETKDELKVISLFHLIAMAMEVYKVHLGSWSYPGFAYSKVWGVPLFAGFMYSSVASYITQAWRRLRFRFTHFPARWINVLVVVAIYGNFYTNAIMPDIRWWIIAGLVAAYWKTTLHFTLVEREYRMPILLGFVLVALFIWFAENFGTAMDAWQYPNQTQGWKLVSVSKISSWALLFVVSFLLVAELKRVKTGAQSGDF